MKLKNKTILITGGTSGLGLAMAKKLKEMDNEIIVTSRKKETIDQITSKYEFTGYTVDTAKIESVKKLKEQIFNDYKYIDIVINFAGVMNATNFFDENTILNNDIEINLIGTININKVFLPTFNKEKESALINVSSGLSYLSSAAHPIYSASKSGVNGLTEGVRSQAKYLGYNKLNIIQLAPPLVSQTSLNDTMHETEKKNPLDMDIDKFVKQSIKGMEKNKKIINPGASKILNILGKIAPIKIREKATHNTMEVEFPELKNN